MQFRVTSRQKLNLFQYSFEYKKKLDWKNLREKLLKFKMGNILSAQSSSSTDSTKNPSKLPGTSSVALKKYTQWTLLTVALLGISYKLITAYQKQQAINLYTDSRRFIQVGIPRHLVNTADTKKKELPNQCVRVMTYNLLAHGPYYCLGEGQYKYCPVEYRAWEYRIRRLLTEIQAYDADILCLQEMTSFMYSGNDPATKLNFKHELKALGYTNVEESTGTRLKDHIHSNCICFKSDKFELLHTYTIRLNEMMDRSKNEGLIEDSMLEECFGDVVTSKEDEKNDSEKKQKKNVLQDSLFYKLFTKCPDIVIVLHLKHITTERELVACTSHVHWNPKHPHVKALQCFLLSVAIDNLMTKVWKLDNENVPVVLGLDANCLPIKRIPDMYDPDIPKEKILNISKWGGGGEQKDGLRSGGYEIFTQWTLPWTDRDHAYSRIAEDLHRAQEKKKEQESGDKSDQGKGTEETKTEKECLEKYWRFANENSYYSQLLWKYGYLEKERLLLDNLKHEWTIPIPWKSVYGVVDEPRFTHKKDVFCGTLDYLLVNDSFRVISYLEMPWQRTFNYHRVPLAPLLGKDTHDTTYQQQNESEHGPQADAECQQEAIQASLFPPIPNAIYSSDHLCLVADLEFMPTLQDTADEIEHIKTTSRSAPEN
ncbi:CCR4-NOT transcription complex, subunit 6-like protein [Reticulomyxa filosa]|uniref:CCR4-NOT transcription complex, subunit 6-like protein n=1 Tax=Reticulomyxa filosa TaxID=46433 RepID=X6M0D4_RETFI|nr:CCR4-NOT transcription complex, subunit 6-like protein [Reticulomyxa filosa]|eukprot:ETO06852.1 CCR4-NOT transcription complex, subunit 6-like protein [Reticulomyxa filosa]